MHKPIHSKTVFQIFSSVCGYFRFGTNLLIFFFVVAVRQFVASVSFYRNGIVSPRLGGGGAGKSPTMTDRNDGGRFGCEATTIPLNHESTLCFLPFCGPISPTNEKCGVSMPMPMCLFAPRETTATLLPARRSLEGRTSSFGHVLLLLLPGPHRQRTIHGTVLPVEHR